MAKAVANSFLDLVKRSQLVEEDQLSKFITEERVRSGGELPSTNEALSAALVTQGLITQWQADKLLAGKHKGFILGKYKLLSHLGKGGMSQVYLAEHMLMKRKVAIKVLPQNRVDDATYLERFRIEARAAAKLDDPNIVRAYDIDQDGNTHYLVMEYVEGQDLHQLVKHSGPLEYDKAADCVAQVARGLEHAHQMGLVHRDIKPANCLLDTKGTVKLLDMGLARLVGDEASLTLDNNENVLGTADYLSPEQALNSHSADYRADIYSLGCTLYFLLTGHPPFPEGTISERLLKHQVEEAPSVLNDRPEAPPGLVNICTRMMAKKPDDRYQSAGDVAERLGEWLADRGYSPASDSKKSNSDSDGVGSGVFRRFAASLERSGSADSSSISSIGRAAEGLPGAKKTQPSDLNEDIGLAPLEEEVAPERATEKTKSADASEMAATAWATSDAVKDEPLKSLIEEQLESGRLGDKEMEEIMARRRWIGEFNPLHPPGFVGPEEGPSPWAIGLFGLGAVVLLGLVVFLLLHSP